MTRNQQLVSKSKGMSILKKFLFPLFALCVVAFSAIAFASPLITHASQLFHRPGLRYHNVCGSADASHARCTAIMVDTTTNGVRPNAVAPTGLNPADLQSAYKLPSATAGSGQTVAVVDAFDDPNAESDLATYRATFGQRPCTTANGCFKKVDQYGGANYPAANADWAVETSLDLDMVSAICPNCNIMLVETNDDQLSNLISGASTAANLGANVVSNSYGAPESVFNIGYSGYFSHPGTIFTASAGDDGYGAQVPAGFNNVVAVGGTSLSRSNNARGWTESAWSGSGSGCTSYSSKPYWQSDSGCYNRTIADVSAVADPNTGVSVYDSYQQSGWVRAGGTSASAPIIAGVYALAGNASSLYEAQSLYAHPDQLFDVVGGSNGSCGGSYLCTAGAGYDGPTGLGTPNGIGAF